MYKFNFMYYLEGKSIAADVLCSELNKFHSGDKSQLISYDLYESFAYLSDHEQAIKNDTGEVIGYRQGQFVVVGTDNVFKSMVKQISELQREKLHSPFAIIERTIKASMYELLAHDLHYELNMNNSNLQSMVNYWKVKAKDHNDFLNGDDIKLKYDIPSKSFIPREVKK